MVINTRTKKRHLIWSELDANPTNPADVNLLIRPAVNFDEGTRYIVALRNLKDADGNTLPRLGRLQALPRRQAHAQPGDRAAPPAHGVDLPHALAGRHLAPRPLPGLGLHGLLRAQPHPARARDPQRRVRASSATTTCATCASRAARPSTRSRASRTSQPAATTAARTARTPSWRAASRARSRCPCYLDQPGCPPGSRFNFAHPWDRTPTQIPGNTIDARFICNIPRAAVDGPGVKPARPSLYGHGLLGDPDEVNAGNVQAMSAEHNFVFCATPWVGMSEEDIGNAVVTLQNFARFPALTDRLQQGFVDFMYLGRLMIHPDGFSDEPGVPGRGPQRDRHAPPLLRRQQPGRHLRRRAHGARARLHPRGARRARG